jgi:hypothetical protein
MGGLGVHEYDIIDLFARVGVVIIRAMREDHSRRKEAMKRYPQLVVVLQLRQRIGTILELTVLWLR